MGRHNHENDVAVPGFDDLVVLSGDDTFFTTPAHAPRRTAGVSQLYTYIAADTDALWNDEGDLWAFVSDTPGVQRLLRLRARLDTTESRATSSRCRRTSRPGKKADGTELTLPTRLPGHARRRRQWRRDRRSTGRSGCSTSGATPRTTRRQERLPLRPRSRTSPTTSGPGWRTSSTSPTRAAARTAARRDTPDQVDERARSGRWCSTERPDEGDVALDPRRGRRQPGRRRRREIHQPDNVETTANEPPRHRRIRARASSSRAGSTDASATTARLWHVPLRERHDSGRREGRPVGRRRADRRRPGEPGGNSARGSRAASSTRRRSSGPGWFLIDVQAHTLWIEKAARAGRRRTGRPGLHVQARRRTAPR